MRRFMTTVAMTIGMTFATQAQVKTRDVTDTYRQDGIAYTYRDVTYLQYVHSVEDLGDFNSRTNKVTGKEIEVVYNYMYSLVGGEAMTEEEITEIIESGEIVYEVYKVNGKMISLLADETDIILTVK